MAEKRALILDSTQIESYLTCPEHWNLSNQQQLELIPRDGGARRPLLMGTYGHKLLELYYKFGSTKQALDIALAFPIGDEFPLEKPDLDLIRRQVTLYSYTYARGDVIPDSPDSVEVGFSEKIYEDYNWIFILEGRIDMLGTLSGQHLFMDHKFQLRAKDLYKKSIQFRNYAMVTKQTTGLINYVRFTKEVNNYTFRRDPISFSRSELVWWRSQLIETFFKIACHLKLAEQAKADRLEQRWSSCSGKYGYPCEFTSVCEQLDPMMREATKKQLYQIKKEWKPW